MSATVISSEYHKKNLRIVTNPDFFGKTEVLSIFKDNKDGTLNVPLQYAYNRKLIDVPKYMPVTNTKFMGVLKQHQKDVAEEYKEILLAKGSVFLQLHCGFGKTILTIWGISTLRLKSLIILVQAALVGQWEDSCKNFMTGGKVSIINKDNLQNIKDSDICICMISAVDYMTKDMLKSFDLVVVDEARTHATEIKAKQLLGLKPKYLIGLSADYQRLDGHHKIMPYFFGNENIIRISQKVFVVYKINTRFKPVIEFTKKGYKSYIDYNLVLESISENQERNRVIATLCKLKPFNKILVLTKRLSHIENIEAELSKLNLSCETFTGNQKKYRECRILLSTYQKAGIGFDGKTSCESEFVKQFDLLIIAIGVRQIEQAAGRVFRADAEIIDIVDDFTQFRKHFEEREKWYRSRKGIIVEDWV